MKIILKNQANQELRVMFEPIGDTFDISSLEQMEIHTQNIEDMTIDFHEENFLSIWIEGDVKVVQGDKEVDLPEIS